jgi:hypothetical protein
MSDGRVHSNWVPGAQVSEALRVREGIHSNWDYRIFLQENANEVMSYDRKQACNGCSACPYTPGSVRPSSNTPFMYDGCLDNRTPTGYQASDLKSLYLTREQLQCRLVTPYIQQAELMGYANANA